MLWISLISPPKAMRLFKFMREFGCIHQQFLWNTPTKHTRSPDAAEVVGGDGGEGHLADGGAGAEEGGGEARGPDAAAPGADGEEVVVVLRGGGGSVGRGGGRDGAAEAGTGRDGGEGAEVVEAAAGDEERVARVEVAG